MTLNDLESHSPVAGLITCNSTNICATFRTVSTDKARCARRVARSLGAIAELPVKTYCNSDPWITETEELAE